MAAQENLIARRVGVLAPLLLLAVTGCGVPRGLHWRPPLDQQIRTRELELVPAAWAPRVRWLRSHLPPPGGDPAALEVEPPPDLLRAAGTFPRPDERASLVDTAVAAGRVNGVQPIRSTRAPLASASLPAEDAQDGRAVFVLSLDELAFLGSDAPDSLLFVRFEFGARELSRAYRPADPDVELDHHLGRDQAFMVASRTDPTPRTLAAWLADDARLLHEAHARAAAGAAPRLVSELVAITGERARWMSCGPGPFFPKADETVRATERRLEWEAWVPPRIDPTSGRITYDVRVFRLDSGVAEVVLEENGIAETRATLPSLVPGATYGWSVRASLELPDGRRFTSAWSQRAFPGMVCEGELAPWASRRFLVAGELSSPPDAEAPAPAAPHPDAPLPPLARRTALSRLRVAPLAAPFASVEWEKGDPQVAAHAGAGAREGALGGVKAAGECGILMPLCLVVLPAVGALGGGVVGAAGAGGDVPSDEARVRAWRGLRDRVAAPALQERLEAEVHAALGGAAAPPGEASDATLEVGVVRAAFVGGRRAAPAMSIELEVGARLVMPDGASGYRVVQASYPAPLHYAWWLHEDGARLGGALGELVARAAPDLVAAVLRAPDGAPPPPRRKAVAAEAEAE